jgi:predicted RND superfamily exporter protein
VIYGGIMAAILLGGWAASSLPFETDISAYNLAADEDIRAYESFVAALGREAGNETIIILEKTAGWHTLADFRQLREITGFWQEQPGMERVSSLANLRYPRQNFFLPRSEPFLDLERPDRFQERMEQLGLYADIVDKFLSRDRKYTLLFVSAPQGISPASARELEQLPALQQGTRAHYLQYDLVEAELQSTLRRDTIVLAAISLGLILLGFYVFTRSLWGLGLIGLMVTFNIALTFIAMHALSMKFTVHMMTIPCIITVLSFTDIMHILYHQQTHYPTAATGHELRQQILAAVRTPLFLTSVTNIIGFLIFLLFANNIHLFNFSLAAILGVVFAYLSSRLLVIRLMDMDTIYLKRRDFRQLYRLHDRVARWCRRRKQWLLPAFIALAILLIGLVSTQLTISGSEKEYTLAGSPLTRGIEILQQEFFGAKQAEVFVTLTEGSIWDKATLDQLEQVEKSVQEIFQPLYINSPVVLVKRYHRYLSNGHPAAYTIPPVIGPDYVARLNQQKERLGGSGIVDTTARQASIVFGFQQPSLSEARAAYAQLRHTLKAHDSATARYQLSGLPYLSDEATYRFSQKILIGLALSILCGSLFVWLLLRSLRHSLGLLLLLGLSVTPLTLFFLSILLGICVDDSIYLIMQHSDARAEPLHIVPIFITSLVLALGFLSLTASSFLWLRPFGWIFLLGIGLAYTLDIFILPLFLKRKSVFGQEE